MYIYIYIYIIGRSEVMARCASAGLLTHRDLMIIINNSNDKQEI